MLSSKSLLVHGFKYFSVSSPNAIRLIEDPPFIDLITDDVMIIEFRSILCTSPLIPISVLKTYPFCTSYHLKFNNFSELSSLISKESIENINLPYISLVKGITIEEPIDLDVSRYSNFNINTIKINFTTSFI